MVKCGACSQPALRIEHEQSREEVDEIIIISIKECREVRLDGQQPVGARGVAGWIEGVQVA